jgi:F0F1-type ATP synthase membrane subunit b/b'
MTFESFLKTFSLTTHDIFMIPVGAVLFLLFWSLSRKMLFGPAQALVELREEATSGSVAEADRISKQARVIGDQVDAAINKALFQGMKEKVEKLARIAAECNEKVAQAEQEAQQTLVIGRRDLREYERSLYDETKGRVEQLAQASMEKILPVAPS